MIAIESEQAVLGCALYFPDAWPEMEALRPEHFADQTHRTAWGHIVAMRGVGQIADPVLVHQQMAGPDLDARGGVRYFSDLMDQAYLPSLEGHVATVIDRARRRDILSLAQDAQQRAKSVDDPSDQILSDLEKAASEIARQEAAAAVPVGMDALEHLNAAREGRYKGTSVGLACLDRITGGIQPDHVWVVAGRTSMGKSIFQTVIPQSIAEQGKGVILFSLEMPRREVQARLIASIAYDPDLTPYNGDGGNVEFADLLRGKGTREQRQRADNAARKLASLPMVVVDKGALTIDQIIAMSRRQMRAWERVGVDPGVVVIDHLGLLRSAQRRDSKTAEVADTIDRLKDAAKQIGAPIIAAAQLNRNAESRTDHRPIMADLNWSGSIEQIADLVCLMYREAYYLERSSSREDRDRAFIEKYELELIVPKNRSGPTCPLKAKIDTACNAIWDAPEDAERRVA